MDHLLFGSTIPTGVVDDDEPVLVVAAGEQRSHLGRWPVAEVRAGVERRVPSGTVDPASNRGEPGGRTEVGWDRVRERGYKSTAEGETRDGRRLGNSLVGEQTLGKQERESGSASRDHGYGTS